MLQIKACTYTISCRLKVSTIKNKQKADLPDIEHRRQVWKEMWEGPTDPKQRPTGTCSGKADVLIPLFSLSASVMLWHLKNLAGWGARLPSRGWQPTCRLAFPHLLSAVTQRPPETWLPGSFKTANPNQLSLPCPALPCPQKSRHWPSLCQGLCVISGGSPKSFSMAYPFLPLANKVTNSPSASLGWLFTPAPWVQRSREP